MSQPQISHLPHEEELTAALITKIDQRRRLDAQILELLGQLDREHVATHAGYSSLAAYVSHATRMSKRAASRLVAHAKAIGQTTTPTGHVTPAPLPRVRDLVRDGAVDGEHVDAITAIIKKLPESTSVEVRQIVETTLADTARVCDPSVVGEQGKALLQHIDQDGSAPDDAEPEVRNELHIQPTTDGGCTLRGRLTKAPTEAADVIDGAARQAAVPDPGCPGSSVGGRAAR